jgi:hypothetical protein
VSHASASWTAAPDALIASLEVGAHRGEVRFEARGVSLEPSPDALVSLLLPLAMRAGVPVELGTGISPRLRSAVPRIESLLHAWFPDRFAPVDVRAGIGQAPTPTTGRTALFFTGGLDSFSEVVRLRGHIDDLIYVQGFDVPPGEHARALDADRAVRAAADELGLTLVTVDTDLRSFSDPYLTWEEYHGAALSAVALMLGDRYTRVLIASSHGGHDLSPWGSHPVLDPLWSTESMEIVHSGYGLTRVDKAAIVSRSEVALRWMRVCYLPPEGSINCGSCEKCLRTAMNLRAVGALGDCASLPHEIRPEQLSALELDEGSRARWVLNFEALRHRGDAPELAAAIEQALRKIPMPNAGVGPGPEPVFEGRVGLETPDLSGGRIGVRQLRRLLLRILRPYTSYQHRVDTQLVAQLQVLRDELEREREARQLLFSELERTELARRQGEQRPDTR